ncbi:MAG TPA: hypothetical protein VJ385_08450 [Fibrobacteria bacterium]|nr:hypothetical protein [Fibrobacteria bacterium]
MAILIWLTWYVGLWLLGAGAVFWLLGRVKARMQVGVVRSPAGRMWRAACEGLYDMFRCVLVGLALLAAIQLVANAVIWISGPGTLFDEEVANALWSSEERLIAVRRLLTGILSPRLTLILLAAVVFLGVARPEWKPVKRVFGARVWVGRTAKVSLVLASTSFFAAEYAALHEDGFVQVRLSHIERAHQRTAEALHQLVAFQWLESQISQSSPMDREDIATLLREAGKRPHGTGVLFAEGDRLTAAWARPQARSPPPEANGDPLPLAVPRSFWRTVAALRGPREPWVTPGLVAAAEQEALRSEARVSEAEAAAIEGAKLALGSLVPSSVEPLLKQFIKVAADALSKTAVKDWFANNREGLAEMLRNPAAIKEVAGRLAGNLGRAVRGDGAVDAVSSVEVIAARVQAEEAQIGTRDAQEAAAERERLQARESFRRAFGITPEEFDRRRRVEMEHPHGMERRPGRARR